MVNSKIPTATTIPLSSLDGKEFYAVIIQEERNKNKWNNLWMFCKGCDVAYFCTGKIAEKDDPTMKLSMNWILRYGICSKNKKSLTNHYCKAKYW
jgi:hypothetical protein